MPYGSNIKKRERILAWLDRRLDEQKVFWDGAPDGSRSGNLRAWAGLAGALVAMQTGREDMRYWAAESVSDVLCTAQADGSLPQEMKRGRFALHYQFHAIAPLVTAIDSTYPLEQTADAIRHSESRRARGKIIIEVPE